MAEEEKAQDKSQDATPKRKADARKEGQVARSKELSTMLLLLSASFMLLISGQHAFETFSSIMRHSLSLPREVLFTTDAMMIYLGQAGAHILLSLAPFFIVVFMVALLSPMLLGGWLFSSKSLAPQFSRMNPISGIKKMFSLRSLVELSKAAAKFTLILLCGIFLIKHKFTEILNLSNEDVRESIPHGALMLGQDLVLLSSVLILFALIDVPYQLWEHAKKLRMSHQDIKDEMKETDGRPEVKARIRQVQRAMSQKRMMEELPTANVIITNPTHYAVALRYDQSKDSAPKLIAKGADLIAERIREVGQENNIEIVSAPPLTRAIYFSTELFDEVPSGLYVAVAQLFAYLFQLKRFKSGMADKPELSEKLPIPDELSIDETED